MDRIHDGQREGDVKGKGTISFDTQKRPEETGLQPQKMWVWIRFNYQRQISVPSLIATHQLRTSIAIYV